MSETPLQRTENIHFDIHLNNENLPVAINWTASDSPYAEPQQCKAMMVAVWDDLSKQTMRMDLWTKNMQIDEMEHFFFQTLATMADTYKKATGNTMAAKEIKNFAQKFKQLTENQQ